MKKSNFPILICRTTDGLTKVNVTFEEDTVWLTQEQMAELFQKSKSTINYHIQQVYEDGELVSDATMRKFENFEFSTKPLNFYNLDMVISVGYRVKSQHHELRCGGTPFYASRLHRTCYAMAGLSCHGVAHGATMTRRRESRMDKTLY